MIKFISENPTIQQYNYLTQQVGWEIESDNIIDEALNNTIYSICAYNDDKIIGFARLIGDKTLFLYIQDVMVIPEFQGRKIGSQLMEFVLNEVKKLQSISPNIRTYLGASKGKEDFYKKFGFITRSEADLGNGMILMKNGNF